MKYFLVVILLLSTFSSVGFSWGSLSHRSMTLSAAEQLEKDMPFLKDERYRKIFVAASSEPDAFVKSDPKIHKHLHDIDMVRAYIRIANKQTSKEKRLEILARAFGNYAHIMEDRTTDNGGYHSSKITFYKYPKGGINNSFIDLVPDLVEFPKHKKELDALKSNSVDPELLHTVMHEYNKIKLETGKPTERIEKIPSLEEIKAASSKLGKIITATKRLSIGLHKGKKDLMKEIDAHLSDRYAGIDGKGGGMNDCAKTAVASIKDIALETGLTTSDFTLPPEKKLSLADTVKNALTGAVKSTGYFLFHSVPRKSSEATVPLVVKGYGNIAENNDALRKFMEVQMAKHAIGIPKDPNNPITKFFLTMAGHNNITLDELLLTSQENVKTDSYDARLYDAQLRVKIAELKLKQAKDKLNNKRWWKFWTWGSKAQENYNQAIKDLENAKNGLASVTKVTSKEGVFSSENTYLKFIAASKKLNTLIDSGKTGTDEYNVALKEFQEAKIKYEASKSQIK